MRSPRPLWLLLLLPVFVLALWLARPRDPDAGKLRVWVLDVGQGDCLFLQTPQGRTMLIDGGGANDEQKAADAGVGEKTVLPFLRAQGVSHLDVVVLTHPHGDHCGGLPAVLRDETIGAVLDGTRLPYPSPAYTAFRDEVRQKRIPYAAAVQGMHIQLDTDTSADVLSPPAQGFPFGTNPDNATVNNYSAVLLVTYKHTRFLLEGDAQAEAEQSMLAAYPNLTADVLKCGHHGAANATTDALLDRVRPRFAALSCGAHNVFGHPNPLALARLSAHHVTVFRTDKNGAIDFVSDGQTVTARPFVASASANAVQ